jgi:CubicO group peptidase (beta-lactamase class C family)
MNNTAPSTVSSLHTSDISSALVHPEVFSNVSALLERGLEEGVYPGSVLVIGMNGREVYKKSVGHRCCKSGNSETQSSMTVDTVFDIAALTNVLVTTTLIMKLVECGKLDLDHRITRYLHGFGVYGKSEVSVSQLLSHSGGLVHWHPFFEELLRANAAARMGILTSRASREYILNSINRSQLKYKPGTKQVYSDIGFILLGHLIEALTGFSLDKAAQQYIFKPLGMKTTSYIDLTLIRRRGIHPVYDMIAATEDCSWRKRILCGEVHDDNAWAMGGISGHSGVFSTARDLHLFAAEMLRAYHGQSSFLEEEIVKYFWQIKSFSEESGWKLGWDSPSEENGLKNSALTKAAVGHNGFTGCSLWLEPELGLDIVLMTNRIHPSRANKKIREFRPQLIDAVLESAGKISI